MFAALAVCILCGTAGTEDRPLEWKGRAIERESLPEELLGPTAQAIDFWAPWAVEHEYRIVASDGGEVLLLWPSERRSSKKPMKLIAQTMEAVQKEFISDATTPATEVEAEDDSARPPGYRPEDLFGPDWRGSAGGSGEATGAEPATLPWGDPDVRRGTDCVVLLQARDPDVYSSALDLLARHFENLRGWTPTAKRLAGSMTLRPLFGAVVEGVEGNEEWSAEHELVHRLSHLLITRRYGTQPVWLVTGIAWNVEMDLLRSVYCYPYRGGFVWATEHTDWDRRLKKLVRERERPYGIADLRALRRDHFDPDSALLAWGLVGYLRRHEPERIPALLELMRDYYWRQGKQPVGEKSWTIAANFEVDEETQDRSLRLLASDEVYAWSTEWFVEGKRWRKPR